LVVENTLVLLDDRGQKHAVPVDEPMARVAGLGTLDSAKVRAAIGRRISVGSKSFIVLRPTALDLRETMARGPQTLAPKDLAGILFGADIVANSRVLEVGSGSGGLTVVLARAVGPSGKVISCDVSAESTSVARANVARTGLSSVVEFRTADVRRGIPDRDLDAVVLDLADPWSLIDHAWKALRPCGALASFSPNMEQVKETVAEIRKRPFVDIRTIELIEREMEVREVGVRPSHAPLGHTGYLTFARKVLDTF
jgi:tRNA (adenine57-N1/adenine58-N1)-methyltransferase catalytic subunit